MLTDVKYVPVAVELFAAAWCNLDCKYCYIPKGNPFLIKKHKQIIEEIKQVTPVINRLKKIYGNDLEIISHWGSEPSLTISNFKDFYYEVLKQFPKFKMISFSSNFMQKSKVDDVIDFIKTFPSDKKITFRIQLSLDGPKWITDENRRGGATEKIVENMIYFIKQLNITSIPHQIRTHFKPTMSRFQYPKMIKNGEVLNYYTFFDNVITKMVNANKNRKVVMSFNCDPTIVCPDDYITQDGINFNQMYENIQIIKNHNFNYVKPDFNYYHGFKKVVLLGHELFTKTKMFTCSAGDSQFGISEYLHPCHDTFYLPYDEIVDSFEDDTDRIQSINEIQNVKSGRDYMTRNILCKKFSDLDEKGVLDYVYLMRGFHDFFRLRLSNSIAVIKELAYANQISKCYMHDEMAELLGAFTITRHSCPTGQMQYLASMNINHISYFRLFGNGLIENFLKKFIDEKYV